MKRFALTFGAGLLALGACAASAQNLRIGLQEDPDVLDPHRARTYVGRIVFTRCATSSSTSIPSCISCRSWPPRGRSAKTTRR